MSIFDSIKNAIFRHASPAARAPAAPSTASASKPATSTASSAPAPTSAGSRPAAAGTAAPATSASGSGASPAAQAPVDVEPVLDALAQKSGQQLNWRTSIVDLMKLLEMDSSLGHRKELAKELGYTGSIDDSAAMNIWLHKQVMTKLAANGGKVPAGLM